MQGIQNDDAMLLTQERDGGHVIIGFGRIFRKRNSLNTISFYFDGYLPANSELTLDQFSIATPDNKATVNRINWPSFENTLKKATNTGWAAFPVIPGETSHEQAYIRELMQMAIKDDIIGPADGPLEEIIGMSVRDRYLVGKLAPQDTVISEDDQLPGAGAEGEQDGPQEVDASTNQSLVPSSTRRNFGIPNI